MSQLMKRLQSSLLREDMRSNPVSALVKRFWWKLRWRIRKDDWPLTLDNGLRLSAPHSGAAALIYYLGSSEPTTTVLLNHHLRPGMVVIDIGAHLGEYTLRASQLVGKTGQVHAFEPDPIVFRYLQQNAARSPLGNITVHQSAVANQQGEMQFAVQGEPSISSLIPSSGAFRQAPVRTISVPVQTIDAYCTEHNLERVDFIKIDIEGAELLAFNGAEEVLSRPPGEAPAIYFEFVERLIRPFGYSGADVLQYLTEHGYTIYDCPDGERLLRVDARSGQPPASPNLFAVKQAARAS